MGIYALLVGINDYAGDVPSLGGCHNDVERVANMLTTRFKVSNANQCCLLSQDATKNNVVTAFQNHLQQAKSGDTAIFYYSGHGSQEKAPKEFWNIEADQQNETLVCHDSRVGGGDLADKELRFLIAEVAKSGAEVVILLDCCHSGHGTRMTFDSDSSDAIVNVRLAKKASYSRAIESYCFYQQAKREGWLYDMQQMPEGKHLIMSGCQDSELSKELNIQGKRHGAFTHYLCETLENTQYSLSYENLLRKVKLQVRNLVDKQNPSLMSIQGAAQNKTFLGNEIQPLRLSVFIKDNKWWLDAGSIHALHHGDTITVYSEYSDAIVLTTTLQDVQTEKSRLQLSPNDIAQLDVNTTYHAQIMRQNIPQTCIAFTGDLAGSIYLFSAMEKLHQGTQPSRYLQEVTPIDCEYRIVAGNNCYVIMTADEDRPLFKSIHGYSANSAQQVLQQAEHLARWNNKLALVNNRSRIPDSVVRMVVTVDGEEFIDDTMNLRYQQQYGEWIAPEFKLELQYDDDAEYDKPLFCSVLIFNPFDASIDTAMDNGIWLRPKTIFDNDAGSLNKLHKVIRYELFDGDSIEACVEEDNFTQGITQSQDIFKLIVSETPFNANVLMQDGLETFDPNEEILGKGVDLDSILDENFAETTRKIRRKSKKSADWATSTLIINTHRPMQANAISANRAISLGVGIEVGTHNIDALISLESSQQSNRAIDDFAETTISPDCFNTGNNHRPFNFSTGRSVDAGLDTLVIQTKDDDQLQQKLTIENPLRITIDKSLATNEQILAYVSDGEFFYPVGFSEKSPEQTQIVIQSLPTFNSDNTHAVENTATQGKGLTKTFKVFFQKVAYDKLRLDYPDSTCLAIAEFDPQGTFTQAVEIDEANQACIEKAQRIMVLVHGIAGEAQTMLPCLTPIKDGYDLVLLFDYESLNTSVEETATIFQQKLEACGLGAEHGKQVDIIALDLGGIMTRWMIEQNGCDDGRISHVVLLGVPNQGSVWSALQQNSADLIKNWAYGSLSLILNNLTSIPVGGHVVAALMKLLEAADNTLEQLHPESELITTLAQTERLNTQYIALIGSTANLMVNIGDTDQSQWAKIFSFVMQRSKLAAFDVLTAKLFKQANDFAFSEQSMSTFPASIAAQVLYAKVDCDHFSYCQDNKTAQQIKQTLL